MTNEERETIQWLGLRFEVPPDWQIVRHTLSPDDGRLVLVDRRRERLELFWRRCKAEPDIDRMLDDQRRKDLAADPQSSVSALDRLAGWRGLARDDPDGHSVVRGVKFDADSGRLLQAVFFTADPAEKALVARLLEKIEIVPHAPDAPTEWRAFDVRACAPPQFELVNTRVLPADVSFEFRATRSTTRDPGLVRARIRRLGMAKSWYDGEPRTLLARESPDARFRVLEKTAHGGHEALFAEAHEPVARFLRLFRPRPARRVLAWHCDRENAVYAVTTVSPPDRPVAPKDFQVRCCKGARSA